MEQKTEEKNFKAEEDLNNAKKNYCLGEGVGLLACSEIVFFSGESRKVLGSKKPRTQWVPVFLYRR
jgi:hypothetical protein